MDTPRGIEGLKAHHLKPTILNLSSFPNPAPCPQNELGFLLSCLKKKQRGNYNLATLNFDRCTGDRKRSQIQEAF